MMRLLLLFLVVALSACDQFEAVENRACAAFFEDRFNADVPVSLSSFKALDEPITKTVLRERFYPGELSQLEQMHFVMFEGQPLVLRTVFFSGDTNVGMGIYELQGFVCRFLLVDGEVYQEDSLIDNARMAAGHAKTSELVSILGDEEVSRGMPKIHRKRELGDECCLP